jgi:peptidyl-prolyl cis-trans isomerase A (cyclophilin A)
VTRRRSPLRLLPLLALLPLSCGRDPASRGNPLLDPSLVRGEPPETFRVRFETTKGTFVVDVYRDWAPHGAKRFYNLVKIGYYDGCAFFRVLPFCAQFGIHGDPKVSAAWNEAFLPADRPKQSNRRGFVSFAQRGSPDMRTTQLFVNRTDNTFLDRDFPPIGQVVEGLDVVDALYDRYGEGAPKGVGPAQQRILYEGEAYLKREFPELDYIRRASVIE